MALHRLTQIVMGVPNVEQTSACYAEFGLTPGAGAAFATADGGEQLRIVPAASRRLVQLGVGADDPGDLDRIAAALAALDGPAERTATSVRAVDPGTAVTVRVEIAPRLAQDPVPVPGYNSPGVTARADQRAPAILREHPVRARKLGHVVMGATAMLAADPGRHVWGLGRHYVGSNFLWYLRDPAGNFSEYYSDLDCIVDDALWKPGVREGPRGRYSWGPPPPFLVPEDLAALITGAHSPR